MISNVRLLQANKEHGLTGKKVLNDDSIVHCGMDVQKRLHEAHLQVSFRAASPIFECCLTSAQATSAVTVIYPRTDSS